MYAIQNTYPGFYDIAQTICSLAALGPVAAASRLAKGAGVHHIESTIVSAPLFTPPSPIPAARAWMQAASCL